MNRFCVQPMRESEKLLISKIKISNKDCAKFQNSLCEYRNLAIRIISIQHKTSLTGTLIFCSGNRTYQKLFEINRLCLSFFKAVRVNKQKVLIDSFSLFLCVFVSMLFCLKARQK